MLCLSAKLRRFHRGSPKAEWQAIDEGKISFGRTIHPSMTSIDGRCSGAAKQLQEGWPRREGRFNGRSDLCIGTGKPWRMAYGR